jgi:hypothetical protein
MAEDSIEHIVYSIRQKKRFLNSFSFTYTRPDPSAHVFNGKNIHLPLMICRGSFNDNGDHFGMEDYHVPQWTLLHLKRRIMV